MRDIYTCIDIGTDCIKIITCEYYNHKFNILASCSCASSGIKKGLIVDASLSANSIKKALKQIEQNLGTKIDKAIAIIPSNNMVIDMVTSKVNNTKENDIIDGDLIFNCMQKALKNNVKDNYEVVGVFPASYKIDDKEGINDALGLTGKNIQMKSVIESVPSKNVYSVVSILKTVGIEVVDIINSGVADYYSIKSKELDNKISAMIDIGEEKTNISVFNKGVIIKDDIMPVGSRNIDADITNIYKVSKENSRKIKEEFAVSNRKYADNEETYPCKTEEGKDIIINQYELSDLIETRIKDILKNAKNIINSLTNKEIGYIIVTGGITSMLGFDAIVEEVYPKNATCLNIGLIGIRENKYSTCYGAIKYFVDKLELREKEYTMFSDTNIEEMLESKKKTGSNSVISKIFGKIFD